LLHHTACEGAVGNGVAGDGAVGNGVAGNRAAEGFAADGVAAGEIDREGFHAFYLYFCHREGCCRKGQVKKRPDGAKEPKKREVYKPSPKVGCTSRLIVHDMKDDQSDPEYPTKGGRKQLRITYYYKHTGHILGDVKEFQHLQVTESTRQEFEIWSVLVSALEK
ncbi:hypothetical protein BGZ76_007099, partial [Entomortierella beljakovae]